MTNVRSILFVVIMIVVCCLRMTSGTACANENCSQSSSNTSHVLSKVQLSNNVSDNSVIVKPVQIVFKQIVNTNGTGNASALTTTTPVPSKPGRCHCGNGVCGCCSRLLIDMLNQRACVNVTYDPDEFSFTAKMWMNDRLLYTRTVKAKNPPPICIPVPRLPAASACVRFYNVYFVGRNVHSCISLEGKFADTIIFKVKLDCVRLGADGVAVVRPEDGDGLGQVQFFPDDPSDDGSDDNYDDYDDDDDDDDDY